MESNSQVYLVPLFICSFLYFNPLRYINRHIFIILTQALRKTRKKLHADICQPVQSCVYYLSVSPHCSTQERPDIFRRNFVCALYHSKPVKIRML
jgi:hypothetical protein